ncbi:hypothetical protein ENBRE01_3381 [Enteropsectra breve]|nr:hypothetical protein ENBRE01_3381 [Enteropsectra breve]
MSTSKKTMRNESKSSKPLSISHNQERKESRCQLCNNIGHTAYECYSRTSNNDQKTHLEKEHHKKIQVIYLNNSSEIIVNIGLMKVKVLKDSGADNNFIGWNLADQYNS